MLHFSKGGNYMYQFPKDLYADIRLEDVYQTAIVYENHNLIQNKPAGRPEPSSGFGTADGGITAPPPIWIIFSKSWTPWPLWPRRTRTLPTTRWSAGWRSTGTGFSGIRTGTCGRCPTRRRSPCFSPICRWWPRSRRSPTGRLGIWIPTRRKILVQPGRGASL